MFKSLLIMSSFFSLNFSEKPNLSFPYNIIHQNIKTVEKDYITVTNDNKPDLNFQISDVKNFKILFTEFYQKSIKDSYIKILGAEWNSNKNGFEFAGNFEIHYSNPNQSLPQLPHKKIDNGIMTYIEFFALNFYKMMTFAGEMKIPTTSISILMPMFVLFVVDIFIYIVFGMNVIGTGASAYASSPKYQVADNVSKGRKNRKAQARINEYHKSKMKTQATRQKWYDQRTKKGDKT